MRVLVTGANGFAGKWLIRELKAAGHEVVGMPPSSVLDITEAQAVDAFVAASTPEVIAHLAGLSFGPDARREPERALAVNAGGTRSVMSAAASSFTPLLVISSADVYGAPPATELPLKESAPLRADQPYGLSKVAQERVVLEMASADGPAVAIIRPFNHTGPGQRPDFVVPALGARILTARRQGARTIVAGNVDVRRDFTDVRDVVRAYRLVLEDLTSSRRPTNPRIYNVASGRAVTIRDIATRLAAIAGIDIDLRVDPTLVRSSDPREIWGDASAIAADLNWHPSIPLDDTLRDVFDDVEQRGSTSI